MSPQSVRGPLLIPKDDGTVVYDADGLLASDETGTIIYAGPYNGTGVTRRSDGIMLPPLLDVHTHVPQYPIRGRFIDGVPENAPGGRLLAGLQRNVFPAEVRCNEAEYATRVVREFYADTLSHGVVGGAAYSTVSAAATEIALQTLPASWSVGLVLMNQNCPKNLRSDEEHLDRDFARLAEKFGRRLIMTDRFAIAVNTPLRKRGVEVAARHGLRTQTHLNEQLEEKEFVESKLYPNAANYTDVYLRDGLLDYQCIVAHCVHVRPGEWSILRDSGSAIAHCPTSNFHLGSGVMRLDDVMNHGIPFAIGTDVGASSTVSMLAEMGRFLGVHSGRTLRATEGLALYAATLAPAKILGLDDQVGRLEAGRPTSFIEVRSKLSAAPGTTDEAIWAILPDDLDDPAPAVTRVTVGGRCLYERTT